MTYSLSNKCAKILVQLIIENQQWGKQHEVCYPRDCSRYLTLFTAKVSYV